MRTLYGDFSNSTCAPETNSLGGRAARGFSPRAGDIGGLDLSLLATVYT